MLTIEKYVLPSPEQWEIIIEGARNPMNSWDRMDSDFDVSFIDDSVFPHESSYDAVVLGPNDYALLHDKLSAGGPVHAKYRRMIPVWATISAPLFWWKEFDTYKVGVVRNSCSTMHKIHATPFTEDMFAHEGVDQVWFANESFNETVRTLNHLRDKFNETGEKRYWRAMIELLPDGYIMKATVFMNYENIGQMRYWRRNHKQKEWHTFVEWADTLPHQELMAGAKTYDE